MLSVSEKYKAAIKGDTIRSRVAGKIVLQDTSEITFADKDIIEGSLSINNKCLNNNNFSFGSVYVGELTFSLLREDINRYSLYNAEVSLSYFLTLSDGSEEEVKLGTYWVEEAKRTKKVIQIKCYDAMTKFDVNLMEDSSGTAFELLSFICEKVGVTLGNRESEINAMPNASAELSMNSERVGTYRDMVSYISTVLCGFATIDRNNTLVIRQFHTEVDDTVSQRRRTSSSIHDYETFFCGVKARFIANSNYYPYEEIDDKADGLILDIGDVPIIQGLEDFKHEILHNIYEVVRAIRYVPATIKMVSDPAIELGDGLTIENANNGTDSVFILVCGYTWTHHKEESIECKGFDALLYKVSSKSERELANLESEISTKNIVVRNYTNTDELRFSDTTEIIKMSYSASVDTTAILLVTIPITMSKDGNVIFTYIRNSIEGESITKYLERGTHFVTFSNYFPCEANGIYRLVVSARTEAYESDTRIHDAKIESLMDYLKGIEVEKSTDTFSIDGTEHTVLSDAGIIPFDGNYKINSDVPVVTIPEMGIKVSLFGQGLNASTKWDGTFNIIEEIEAFTIGTLESGMFEEKLSAPFATPNKYSFTDSVIGENLSILNTESYEETVDTLVVQVKQTVTFAINDFLVNDTTLKLKNEYEYSESLYDIDDGILVGCLIPTSDKDSIESLEVICV